jgi:alpha-amylase
MLPDRDAIGQIEMMRAYLRRNFGSDAQGLWVPERVWEPSLATTFAQAGARYAVLDDFHFRATGLPDAELDGHFITEDRGSLFRVFPLREELRYAIPYKDPQATVDYLLARATEAGDRVVVYADDGEKFGVWPRTKEHVFGSGWLDRFLSTLEQNADRIRMITFSEAAKLPPRGRIYLPTCSYREMGEWSLLNGSRREYDDAHRQLAHAQHLMPGGLWRNFRVKYPEANLMYGRMLSVSRRVAEAPNTPARRRAEVELYRAQCNCGYWHGVFGGLYLSHLRGSVYRHLIAAERELEKGASGVQVVDLDLDDREDVRLFNDHVNLFVTPAVGGHVVELDYRPKLVNFTATLARRPEPYHERVRQATTVAVSEAKSIHDLNVAKRADLDRHLAYDTHPRATLVDHFLDADGKEIGDFATGAYLHEVLRRDRLIAVRLSRSGRAGGVEVSIDKEIRLERERAELQVDYTLRAEAPLEARFGVEFNLACLSPAAPDAFFSGDDGHTLGALGEPHEWASRSLWVRDAWHDLWLAFFATPQATYTTYPVNTVSQSESGFELGYQSTVVMPWWPVKLEPGKPWSTVISHRIEQR